jgi:ATP-dependent Lon protease
MGNLDYKIASAFPKASLKKSKSSSAILSFLELPSEVKDWLLMKFTDGNNRLDAYGLSTYIEEMRLAVEEFNIKMLEARHSKRGTITLLTKIKIEFDYAKDLILFELPEYGFPQKKGTALADWSTVSDHKKYLLTPDGAFGEVTLCYDCGTINLQSFKPLCPYTFDLKEYAEGRKQFTTEEWIDVILASMGYNPDGYTNETEKLTMIQRFLPMVEKRVNLVDLGGKGTSKSYCYSQTSAHGWLTSGSGATRAKMFYDITRRKVGYFGINDFVALDEVQSLRPKDGAELSGILKAYLENGQIRVGDFMGNGDAGCILLGNIPEAKMDTNKNMFATLPNIWKESALVDRFHGIIRSWNIPRVHEGLKMEGTALSTDYITEIFHQLRDKFYFRAFVDDMIKIEGRADTRNTEAVKRLATAFLKLLFPHVTSVDEIDKDEFKKYCLDPAYQMREDVLKQLRLLDSEYEDKLMPNISL